MSDENPVLDSIAHGGPTTAAVLTRPVEPDPMLIVLIEDDDLDAELIGRLVGRSWPDHVLYRCATLSDGESALGTMVPDLVLVDLGLPDCPHEEVVERTRRAAGTAPVIVLTGDRREEPAAAALVAGAQDYLVKGSFDIDALQRSVRHSQVRVAVERELREANTRLRRSNRDLEDYASIAAHDLRGPVRTARMLFDRYRTGAAGPESESVLGGAVAACLDRLEGTIDGLLWFATMTTEHQTAVDTTADIATIADIVRQDLEAGFEAAGGIVDLQATGVVACAPQALTEVMRNVVENAIKYRSPERRLLVRISATTSGDRTIIRTTDNGTGIAPADRERVFELFQQLERADAGGSGLGLTFCARVMEVYDGRIWIEDAADGGPGTTVAIELPTG